MRYRHITKTDDVMGGEPRIKDRRVSVRQIAERIETNGEHPIEVAEIFELEPSWIYEAMLYYHENTEEIKEIQREIDELLEQDHIRKSPSDLDEITVDN